MTTTLDHFTHAANTYLADLPSRSKSVATIGHYEQVLTSFAQWLATTDYADATDCNEITPLMVVEWKQSQRVQAMKASTLRHNMTVLSVFFKWCVKMGLYKSSPISADDMPKQKQSHLDLLNSNEIGQIVAGFLPPRLHKKTALRNRAMVVLMLQSGVRVSELIALRLSDLDFNSGTVTVAHGKGDKRRTTTFPENARRFVSEWLNSCPEERCKPADAPLFSRFIDGRWQPLSTDNVTIMVKRYVYQLTGHKGIGAHDLRHAFASYLLTKGATIDNIQKVLGHAHYGTTLIYAENLLPDRIPQNLNALFGDTKETVAEQPDTPIVDTASVSIGYAPKSEKKSQQISFWD